MSNQTESSTVTAPKAGPRTRGPYAKTAQVRLDVTLAATEAFAQTGFRATTMKEIARRAGISERGLAHHFATKELLLAAVLQQRDEATAALVPGQPGAETFAGVLATVSENSTEPRLMELHSTLSAEATATEHPAHEHYSARYSSFRNYLSAAFQTTDRAGSAIDLNTDELAAMLIALQDGLQIQWLYNPEAIDITKMMRAFIAAASPSVAIAESEPVQR